MSDSESNASTCETFVPIDFSVALKSLPKKELIRLLTLAGESPKKSQERERGLLATNLAKYVDKMTLVIEWDVRMTNSKDQQKFFVTIDRGCMQRRYVLNTIDDSDGTITAQNEPMTMEEFRDHYGFSEKWPHEFIKND